MIPYTEVFSQNYHMQDFTTDGTHLYWSFTDSLVMTTMAGTVLRQVPCASRFEHLGGIDYADGRIYGAAMCRGPIFSSIHVYDADTLGVIDIIPLRDCMREAAEGIDDSNGIGCVCVGFDPADGERCLLIGVAIKAHSRLPGQLIYTYTFDGKRRNRYLVPTGATTLGVQNIARDPDTGSYYMATYGAQDEWQNPHTLYKISPDLTRVEAEYGINTPYGLHCLGGGRFYFSLQGGVNGHRTGIAYEADGTLMEALSPLTLKEGDTAKWVRARLGQPLA